VSDTPRTDAEDFYPHHSNKKVCDADFARQLERELNAANERIKRMEEVGDEMLSWLPEDGISMKNLRQFENEWRKAKEAKL